MDHMESDQASNDATTIIAELLNSDEAMQSSLANIHPPPPPMPIIEQKDENQNLIINAEFTTNCDKQEMLIPMQQNSVLMINNSYGPPNDDDINKMQMRHVHIPYILNGELYQIQTQDGENVTVKCCHCPPDRVYRGSVRSTGNFHMHIKRRHPDLLEKLHDMKVNALLERRDRLMRNRKITHRNNRHRSTTTTSTNAAPICSLKSEPKSCLLTTPIDSQLSLTSAPDLSLIHNHNLKIKTVFQRHQMQQREAAEMRNWSNSNYAVVPIAKLTTNEEDIEEPINYSLKSQESSNTTQDVSSSSNSYEQQQQQELQKINTQSCTNFTNISNQPTSSSIATEQNEFSYENHQLYERHLSTSSISVSCPSVMSSFSSNHNYNMETDHQYNLPNNQHHHHNLSIIKPEHLLIETETEAIDLTMNNESGIFSNTTNDLSFNDSQNINNVNRAGSQITSPATTAAVVNGSSSISCNNIHTKWQELLMQVETSLQDIQREMNVRNHIESNRMFLDIAKFKFLHPGFQFNW